LSIKYVYHVSVCHVEQYQDEHRHTVVN